MTQDVAAFVVAATLLTITPGLDTALVVRTIHAVISVLWFAVLISATAPLARALRSPRIVRGLDRMVGVVFVGFGVRLGLSARR